MKVIISHNYCYAVPSLATSHLCKKYQIIYKSVHSYLCACMRNKYPWRSEFVGKVSAAVFMYKAAKHRYSYFEKSCRKKCTRQSRKVLWVVLNSLLSKEVKKKDTRGHGRVFAGAKRKQQK